VSGGCADERGPARSRARSKRGSLLEGSSTHCTLRARSVAVSQARGTPSKGRSRRTSGCSICAAMPARPAGPLRRAARMATVSA
jgi:hypothetical protein